MTTLDAWNEHLYRENKITERILVKSLPSKGATSSRPCQCGTLHILSYIRIKKSWIRFIALWRFPGR